MSGSTFRSDFAGPKPSPRSGAFPIETVSQSEGGFEGVYQSSAVIPRWTITAGPSRRWEVQIRWSVEPARTEAEPATEQPAQTPGWSLVDG